LDQEGTGGAGDEVRTRDMQLGRLPLCQLSYSRTGGVKRALPVGLRIARITLKVILPDRK
jgi:hypothetical protein